MIRSIYTETWTYYNHLEDKRLFWKMIKMEIRRATISYEHWVFRTNVCRVIRWSTWYQDFS